MAEEGVVSVVTCDQLSGATVSVTVGQGTGFDQAEVERDALLFAADEKQSAAERDIYCIDHTDLGIAAKEGYAATEAAASLLAQRCPSFAKSRRLMELDDAHGPPTVGTEGWLDPNVLMAMAEDKSDVCGDRARLAACFAVTDDESPDLAVINACYAVTEEKGSTSTNAPVEPLVAAGSGAAEPKRSWKGILQARDDPCGTHTFARRS